MEGTVQVIGVDSLSNWTSERNCLLYLLLIDKRFKLSEGVYLLDGSFRTKVTSTESGKSVFLEFKPLQK